jgi:S-DNA-T family DNA segregation ATPase FtsK/SpoIIIE
MPRLKNKEEGVHLILATQKPSGVVDDQIWSNSRFKIALKVQNTSDTNEVLHTPTAVSISTAKTAGMNSSVS